MAVGRVPLIDSLNLAAAKVETRKGGYIVVDEFQQTSAPGEVKISFVTYDDCTTITFIFTFYIYSGRNK